jgi:hypothetical protein
MLDAQLPPLSKSDLLSGVAGLPFLVAGWMWQCQHSRLSEDHIHELEPVKKGENADLLMKSNALR